jgi:hypothetical protein
VKTRHGLLEYLDPFTVKFRLHDGETRHVAARLGKALCQTGPEKIGM